jgi:hypothetical protein
MQWHGAVGLVLNAVGLADVGSVERLIDATEFFFQHQSTPFALRSRRLRDTAPLQFGDYLRDVVLSGRKYLLERFRQCAFEWR